ncbi:MAG: hypothetical protein ALECFALPRED_000478 [Alectoria fallacina]|uniref:Uncharacterized protein n=1 Tax=Alectoria fallacina TaxID=1903189 RepID=A0A8H3ILI4_9LECA|nr:MAG: hypothetical protein ALECFALPRED_000478 [Alectoria fallacina]
MQPTLTLFSILLTLSTFSHASRLAPAKRSNLAPRRQNCPPLSPSEKIITKKEIVDGNQECVPDPSSKPSTQPFSSAAASAFAAAESATTTTTTVSVAEALEAAHNRNGISAGALVPANPDPCGPPTGQAPGAAAGSLSTCRANVSVANLGQPSAYGVQCANDGSGYTLEQTTCADSSITICDQISGLFGAEYQRTNTWIWSTQDGNCTFGYWLPKNGAPPPSFERCQEQITSVINQYCMGPVFNAGGVNLNVFPSAGASNASSTGLPVDPLYPSYVMLPFQSHCGINSMDVC